MLWSMSRLILAKQKYAQVKNPNQQGSDQSPMYQRIRGVEQDISWTNFTCWSERDLNSGSPDF